MRGFQTGAGAQTVCQGHGVIRNLRGGCYQLGLIASAADIPQAPLLVRAWDELTAELLAG